MDINFSVNFKGIDGTSLTAEKKGLNGKPRMSESMRKVKQRNGALTISSNTKNDEEKTDNMDKVYTCIENLILYTLSPGGPKKWITYIKKGSLMLKCYRKALDFEKEFKIPNWSC